MRRRPWHYGIGDWLPGILVIAAFLVAIAYFIWFHFTHVCVATRDYECASSTCTFTEPESQVCLVWDTEYHTCTECVQWERR